MIPASPWVFQPGVCQQLRAVAAWWAPSGCCLLSAVNIAVATLPGSLLILITCLKRLSEEIEFSSFVLVLCMCVENAATPAQYLRMSPIK